MSMLTTYKAGKRVARDDGRFYVPVLRETSVEGLSDTVLRVASDAFTDVESAEVFADIVVGSLNAMLRRG